MTDLRKHGCRRKRLITSAARGRPRRCRAHVRKCDAEQYGNGTNQQDEECAHQDPPLVAARKNRENMARTMERPF